MRTIQVYEASSVEVKALQKSLTDALYDFSAPGVTWSNDTVETELKDLVSQNPDHKSKIEAVFALISDIATDQDEFENTDDEDYQEEIEKDIDKKYKAAIRLIKSIK